MISYDDAIHILISQFKDLENIYFEDPEYYSDLPYVFYESKFTSYIMKIVINNNYAKEQLQKIFEFVEYILANGDEKTQNLVEVSVIESLFFEKDFMIKFDNLSKLFGEKTLNSFKNALNTKNKLQTTSADVATDAAEVTKIAEELEATGVAEKAEPNVAEVSGQSLNDLPEIDENGNLISYKEYDINPNAGNRDSFRFVQGSNGKTYYTDSHYNNFVEISK